MHKLTRVTCTQVRPTWIDDPDEQADLIGTYEIVCELSDGTSATPMGGCGFPSPWEALKAMAHVCHDGRDSLFVLGK